MRCIAGYSFYFTDKTPEQHRGDHTLLKISSVADLHLLAMTLARQADVLKTACTQQAVT